MTEVGSLYMDVLFDIPRMQQDLTAAGTAAASNASAAMVRTFDQRLTAMGPKIANFGKQWSLFLSAPLAAGGLLATRDFVGFESKMSKIESLVGESHDQVTAWSSDVRRIGTDFGIGAQDAADALYFITSSGISGSEAIEALEQSAKASAVGLGETKTIADLVTSALNAYAGTGLTAARSTDVLVAAVRAGKSEPDELAGSMGRVLPIAANLGVTFDQVAGAMAAMSLTGTNADEAATQLRGILNGLLKPSKQAEEALAGVGLSSDGLRRQIADEGLLPTLETLVTALGNDAAATALVFDDVRALTGVMNVLGKNADQTRQIMSDTAVATGDLDRSFKTTQETAEFKLNQSLAEVHDSLIAIGEDLAPIAEKAAAFGAGVAGAFSSLPGPLRGAVEGVAGIAIVTGPALFAVGKLSSGIGKVVQTGQALFNARIDKAITTIGMTSETANAQAQGLTTGMGRFAKGAAAAGIAVAGLSLAYSIWSSKMEEAREQSRAIEEATKKATAGDSFDEAGQRISRINEQIAGLQEELGSSVFTPIDADYIAALTELGEALQKEGQSIQLLRVQAVGLAKDTGRSRDETFKWLAEQALAGIVFPDAAAALEAYRRSLVETGGAAISATDQVKQARVSIEALSSSFFTALDATAAYKNSLTAITSAQRSQEQAQRRVADAARSYQDAQQRVTDAERARTQSLRRIEDAQRSVIQAQTDLNDALAGPGEDDQISLERAQLRVEQARKALKGKFEDPLDKKQAELDVRQAEADLKRLNEEFGRRVDERQEALVEAEDRLRSAEADAEQSARAVTAAQVDLQAAGIGVADAQREAADASDGVARAQEAAARSAFELNAKQDELTTTWGENRNQIEPFIVQLENLKRVYPEVAGSIQPYIDKIRELQSLDPANLAAPAFANKYLGAPLILNDSAASQLILDAATKAAGRPITDLGEAKRIIIGGAQGRALGGPTTAGTAYGINERGVPEIFSDSTGQYLVPLTDGYVTPLGDFTGSKAGAGINIEHLEVKGQDQPHLTAWEMERSLRRVARGSRRP